MKKLIIAFVVLVVIGVGYYWYKQKSSELPENNQASTGEFVQFESPKKSAHYESNTPAHAATLPGAPLNVVIDFNFDLSNLSTISITGSDGKEYGIGDTQIDANKLAMRRNIQKDAPNGLYNVNYNACWPDGSCHDGHFQFVIDRNLVTEAVDMRNQVEVMIDMKDFRFIGEIIRISRGTKITWINSDSAPHYVNTDSHPAHTYYPTQNSPLLKRGDSYSLTFTEPGVYPYHCSAHARVMIGTLIVE